MYPGLPSHPQHELAKSQMKGGFGGMMSFDVKGGKNAGITLVEVKSFLYSDGLYTSTML